MLRSRSLAVLIAAVCAALVSRAWAIQHFIVFFPKTSCTITVEAVSVIATFADVAKAAKKVIVAAHAGRDEGSPDEIMQLSRCRGDAVKAQLVNEGLDADRIAVLARGDSEPLSPGFDGDPRMDRQVQMDMTE